MAGVLACTAAVCLPFGLRTGFLDPDPKKVPPKVWTVWGDQAIGICEEVQLHGVDSVGGGQHNPIYLLVLSAQSAASPVPVANHDAAPPTPCG